MAVAAARAGWFNQILRLLAHGDRGNVNSINLTGVRRSREITFNVWTLDVAVACFRFGIYPWS